MRKILLAPCFILLLASRLFSQQNEPIIDVHMHAYNLSHQKDTAWYPTNFKRPATDEELMRQSIAMMDKYHIVQAVASGDPKTVQKWQAAAPGHFIPGYETWEAFTPDHMNRLSQQIKSGEVKVLAEIVTEYEGIGASDSAMEPLYQLAEQNDVPVGIHMGPGPAGIAYNTGYRSRLSSPLLSWM